MLIKVRTLSLDKPWLDTKIRTCTNPNLVPKQAHHTQQYEFRRALNLITIYSAFTVQRLSGCSLACSSPKKQIKHFGEFIKSLLLQALAGFGRGSVRFSFARCWSCFGLERMEESCSLHRRDWSHGLTTCCLWQQCQPNLFLFSFPFWLCQHNHLWNQAVKQNRELTQV